MKTVHAVYEKGMFRLLEAVELPDHARLNLSLAP
jgi:predicted DNA-binding antitoxin AbrB/MazE fold protein